MLAWRGLLGVFGLLLIGTGCGENGSAPKPGGATALGPTADIELTGHVFKVQQLPAPDVSTLTVPSGFSLT